MYAVMYQESDIHQSLLAAKASLAKKGLTMQPTKKVVSNSPGLMDFAIRLVNSLLNLPDGKWSSLRNSTYRRTVKSFLLFKKFWGLFEMTFGLVNVSFSLPKWQAVKMTFFAPCHAKAGGHFCSHGSQPCRPCKRHFGRICSEVCVLCFDGHIVQ